MCTETRKLRYMIIKPFQDLGEVKSLEDVVGFLEKLNETPLSDFTISEIIVSKELKECTAAEGKAKDSTKCRLYDQHMKCDGKSYIVGNYLLKRYGVLVNALGNPVGSSVCLCPYTNHVFLTGSKDVKV